MAAIDIRLPEDLRSYIEQQARVRGQDPSGYIRSLVEAEQSRNLRSELETSLLEASRSSSSPWTNADLAEIRKAGHAEIKRRQSR